MLQGAEPGKASRMSLHTDCELPRPLPQLGLAQCRIDYVKTLSYLGQEPCACCCQANGAVLTNK